jgi:tryptophanyl-tRNA synthetase
VPPLMAGADQRLREAIATKRLVSFRLEGRRRIAEPHDLGIINGVARLFFYQLGGESRSGRPLGWRWGDLSKISEVQLLDERFSGPRPAPSGRHAHWDVLMATVSPRPVSQPRGGRVTAVGARKRILTGIRPTGPLHLGHYAGALENWVRLQADYDCSFLIADYQVSDYADDVPRVRQAVWEVALDWLAVGLDPERSSFVIESLIPEHAELTLWLSWFLPLGMLQRNPTLKAEMEDFGRKSVPVAFFTYPVMQVANILLPRAHVVPVGEDQLPHIELTREVARRFNRQFKDVFPEPEALVGRVPRLVGTDGQAKMSKSLDNAIYLKDSPAVVNEKVRAMYTDPTRLRASDPGHVEGNPVFLYHDAFNPNRDEVTDLQDRYRRGAVGDVEVKHRLAAAINTFLDPIRERRARHEANMRRVRDALAEGTDRARRAARMTMALVREALDLGYLEKHSGRRARR